MAWNRSKLRRIRGSQIVFKKAESLAENVGDACLALQPPRCCFRRQLVSPSSLESRCWMRGFRCCEGVPGVELVRESRRFRCWEGVPRCGIARESRWMNVMRESLSVEFPGVPAVVLVLPLDHLDLILYWWYWIELFANVAESLIELIA